MRKGTSAAGTVELLKDVYLSNRMSCFLRTQRKSCYAGCQTVIDGSCGSDRKLLLLHGIAG